MVRLKVQDPGVHLGVSSKPGRFQRPRTAEPAEVLDDLTSCRDRKQCGIMGVYFFIVDQSQTDSESREVPVSSLWTRRNWFLWFDPDQDVLVQSESTQTPSGDRDVIAPPQ